MRSPLLEIDNLCLSVPGDGGERPLLRGVELSVGAGEVVSIVGESGSGKSLTARAVMGMLPNGATTTGSIRFAGESVLDASAADLRDLRSRRVAMIFQDPRAHINPVRRIGDFLMEGVTAVGGMSGSAARARALELLAATQIEDPGGTVARYPHELSGGMLQRVMIAGALMGEPELLLADEPTTALDVTTQAEVMAILARLRREFELAILFITHDLELAAATADRTTVMYAGRVVEEAPSAVLHEHPEHPYTVGLLRSRPSLGHRAGRLEAIKGRPIEAAEVSGGCAFAPRCGFAEPRCLTEDPRLLPHGAGTVACLRAGELGQAEERAHA
ncbi:MAG: ABC transporter ATP-binding protein [Solirubrobacterales bacterium]